MVAHGDLHATIGEFIRHHPVFGEAIGAEIGQPACFVSLLVFQGTATLPMLTSISY